MNWMAIKELQLSYLILIGNHFIIKLRQNTNVINDFSAILAFRKKGYTNDFKLKRYNGKSHEHSNKLEGEKFYDFHIHIATQRYQDIGKKEESYGKITDRFSNLRGALKCLIEDCNVRTTLNTQANLFEE